MDPQRGVGSETLETRWSLQDPVPLVFFSNHGKMVNLQGLLSLYTRFFLTSYKKKGGHWHKGHIDISWQCMEFCWNGKQTRSLLYPQELRTAMNGWFLTKLALRRWAAKCYVFKSSVSPSAKKQVIEFVTVLLCNICILYIICIHIHMNHIWVLPFTYKMNLLWIFPGFSRSQGWHICDFVALNSHRRHFGGGERAQRDCDFLHTLQTKPLTLIHPRCNWETSGSLGFSMWIKFNRHRKPFGIWFLSSNKKLRFYTLPKRSLSQP